MLLGTLDASVLRNSLTGKGKLELMKTRLEQGRSFNAT